MKTLNKIPTSKIERATKLVTTGVKVGVNYVKYYGNKITQSEEEARSKLNEENATDIYNGLKELKGSALKVAQMLSMEKNLLPNAYVEKFSLSQFSVPPLSGPLVVKTFKKYFKKLPTDVFDTFTKESVNAASIGQVHKATVNNKNLAVKIQYPGIADSISSDLAMVKPMAMKMFNIQGEGSDEYFKEVEEKLLEETNYNLELAQSNEIANACKHIPNLRFPKYYKEYSSERILTMDWMDGVHLSEFTEVNTNPEMANKLGQALWDFYMYQMHVLKKVHADPHPGNFLVSKEGELIVIDFGCMKKVPESFYIPYFELAKKENIENPSFFESKLYELEILRKDDTEEEIVFFKALFYEMLSLFTQPFQQENFDFSDDAFFGRIADLGQKYAKSTELRKMNGNRGSKHFIYINRTFFGLYNLMHDLKAKDIVINNFKNL
ncbi:lipopolysaccharide core heptose(II) kinase RfaY [uncultured Tenacibaculum sp.]|uniref:ABC1 kinase family protein n=1 Tax=uncultured Tenacibaculum sp. TaxID=174713 RepID=UPI002632B9E8|nr:lipopolysaccharide core heptose(II) kinase RfaY [uncultured Tenacibaculum sp.]